VHWERGERWQLWYCRTRPGRSWEAPLALADLSVAADHDLSIGEEPYLRLLAAQSQAQVGQADVGQSFSPPHKLLPLLQLFDSLQPLQVLDLSQVLQAFGFL
jgi:hypothetical protein